MVDLKRNNNLKKNYLKNIHGFTLIEMLVAITVSSIFIGVVIFTLKTSLETYYFVQDDVFLQDALNSTLQIVSEGNYEYSGIKDALEILSASSTGITFVPYWTDQTHISRASERGEVGYLLNRPFKSGASLPIGEVFTSRKNGPVWKQFPLQFITSEVEGKKKTHDKVDFTVPVPIGAKIKFVYHPDVMHCSECVMTIKKSANNILRIYKNKSNIIPKLIVKPNFTDVRFQYFDNSNTEIIPDPDTGQIPSKLLTNITAVKFSLKVEASNYSREGSVFINIRNTKSSGSGFIIRKGTQLKIPNSKEIRSFSLVNIVGVKNNGKIILEAVSDQGQSLRFVFTLGLKDDSSIVKKYSVEYPAGQTVYSEAMEISTDFPVNLLGISHTGRYDYDFDGNMENVINMKGNVELTVVEMDADGAALFIRP